VRLLHYKIKFIIIALILVFIANIRTAYATPTQVDASKIILIDPGHGGMDGGAVSKRGTLEKDINLNISLKLRDKLVEHGYIVLMTREQDNGLYKSINSTERMKYEDLNNRCIMKRDSNCDVFISIHQNFFPESKYYGAQVWYSNSAKSKLLAQLIQTDLRETLNNNNKREEKPAGNQYKILRCYTDIPSVIVECGFLTNLREEIQLRDENYQAIIAESITDSLDQFFKAAPQ
jgi:N-acetylmuramoyl-L-alanine amidase